MRKIISCNVSMVILFVLCFYTILQGDECDLYLEDAEYQHLQIKDILSIMDLVQSDTKALIDDWKFHSNYRPFGMVTAGNWLDHDRYDLAGIVYLNQTLSEAAISGRYHWNESNRFNAGLTFMYFDNILKASREIDPHHNPNPSIPIGSTSNAKLSGKPKLKKRYSYGNFWVQGLTVGVGYSF